MIDKSCVGNLGKRALQVAPYPLPLSRFTRYAVAGSFYNRIDFSGSGWIVNLAAIHPPRCFHLDPILLSFLDHGEAEIVIVEPKVTGEIEELPLLGPAVEDDVCMGMIAVFMDGDHVVEMALIGIKEALTNV